MIQGVKIQISSEELKKHLLDKVTHHKEKADFYNAQVSNLEKGADEHTVGGSLYNASNNPVQSLKESGKKHQAKSEYFQFIADHLVPDTYELTEQDLTKLEIISGGMFW